MEQGKMDRRVQRTQGLLQEALLALIQEKGYAAVTIQDILDRANLGRSTFYAHYRDKDDLLVSGFEHLKAFFETSDSRPGSERRESSGQVSSSLAFFRHVGEHQRLYKALVGKRGGEIVQNLLYQYVSDLMRNHLEQHVIGNRRLAVPREVLIHYYISSLLALLTWWLDHDMPYTADQMDAMFNTLTMPGMKDVLGTSV